MQKYAHGGDVYGQLDPALDFSISLNPMGPPPQVLEAAQSALWDWNRYPDPRCRALRRTAAQREGVPEKFLLFGNGAGWSKSVHTRKMLEQVKVLAQD